MAKASGEACGDIPDVTRLEALGIVGAGGGGFPAAVKLRVKVPTVIVNGAECEPLLHKDKELLQHQAGPMLRGLDVAMALVGAREGVVGVKEKYRAVLWNPPFLHFLDIFSWVERTYGVTLIIDSMTYNSLPLIDTSSPDSMLRGMGNIIMQGPMARHTRGPAENYLDDIFRIYRQFDLDMIWVAGHVGCKNTAALNGVLREMCREAGIPLLILDYDLSDPRIVTHEGMITQVEHFMENVMKAERLAP